MNTQYSATLRLIKFQVTCIQILLRDLIKEFYNSKLTNTEKKKIAYEGKIYIEDIKNKKDILKLTNQCFVEELEYKNGVFILRIGS